MKKAYLVTFMITTRVITEEEGDPDANLIIAANALAYNDIISKACNNLYEQAPDFSENITEITKDTECPYGTFEGED